MNWGLGEELNGALLGVWTPPIAIHLFHTPMIEMSIENWVWRRCMLK